MDNPILPNALKEAGVRLSTKEHPGKGRGPIKVKRHDVEQFFLDNRDLWYQAGAIASTIGKPKTSVATHLSRMLDKGVLIIQDPDAKYGHRAYKVRPSFKKLSAMQQRGYTGPRPPQEVSDFFGRSRGNMASPPSLLADDLKDIKQSVLTNLPRVDESGKSVSELIATLEVTLAIAMIDLDRLKTANAALKDKVGAIL